MRDSENKLNVGLNLKLGCLDTTKALVHAFIPPRVDYCNSLLYGLPAIQINKVQRVLIAAANKHKPSGNIHCLKSCFDFDVRLKSEPKGFKCLCGGRQLKNTAEKKEAITLDFYLRGQSLEQKACTQLKESF